MTESLMAEFPTADAMLSMLRMLPRHVRAAVDTYAPFDVPDLEQVLDRPRSRLGWTVTAGAVAGALLGYGIQWWTAVRSYPLNTGGRPVHAVPSFMVITFESAVLGGALLGVLVFFVQMRLPCLWAREDEIPQFKRAAVDRFWVRVDAPAVEQDAMHDLLKKHGALRVVPMPLNDHA